MDAALLGASIIAWCLADGVFETSTNRDKHDGNDSATPHDTEEDNDEHDE